MHRYLLLVLLFGMLTACSGSAIQATETGLKGVATTAVASSMPVATDFVEISSTPEPTAIPAAEGETPIDPPPVLPPTEGVQVWQELGMGYTYSQDAQEVKWVDSETGNEERMTVDAVTVGSDGSLVLLYQDQLAGIVQADGRMQRAFGNYVALNHELRKFDPATLKLEKDYRVLNVDRLEVLGEFVGVYSIVNNQLVALLEPVSGVIHEVFYGKDVVVNNVHLRFDPETKTMRDVRELETATEYVIREGYREQVRGEVNGLPVSLDIVTDAALGERAYETRVEKVFLKPGFVHQETGKNAADSVAEATMRALYYVWRDNDPALNESRQNFTFEQYVEMVKDYQAGSRSLADVALRIWANDLQTAEYDPIPWLFDPTQQITVKFIDNEDSQLIGNTVLLGSQGDDRVGTQRTNKGIIEIWCYLSEKYTNGVRSTRWVSGGFAQSINRLGWTEAFQLNCNPKVPNRSIREVYQYHGDVYSAMANIKLVNEFTRYEWGSLDVYPSDTGE